MPKLDAATRNIAISRIKAKNHRMMLPERTIFIVAQSKAFGDYQQLVTTTDRLRSGRRRVTTQAQDRYSRLFHLRNRTITATETAVTSLGCAVYYHRQTGEECGSDESRFQLEKRDGRIRVYSRRNERFAQNCVVDKVESTEQRYVMRIENGLGMSFFDLWKLTNVSCGNITAGTYRDDYVDRLNSNCIKTAYLLFDRFDGEAYYYNGPLTSNIEDLLKQEPSYIDPHNRANKTTEKRLIKHGKYEFLVLNQNGDKIYAGIYDDPNSPDRVQFVYNNAGAQYTENQDPTTFPGIKIAHSLEVMFQIDSTASCTASSQSTIIQPCPSKPTFPKTTYIVSKHIGEMTSLSCQYTTNSPLTELTWHFENGINKTISDTSNPVKYYGASLTVPQLTIYGFSESDVGRYYCRVGNIAGISTGSYWHINLLQESPIVTIPQTSYELVVGSFLTLKCSYNAYPNATIVEWRTSSSIFRNCSTEGRTSVPSIDVPSITINNVEMCDVGYYQCCVTNSINTACGNVIHVVARPFVKVPEHVSTVVHSNKTIDCEVFSDPPATAIEWQITTETGTSYYNSEVHDKYSGSTTSMPSLTIKSATLLDAGNYTCIANNSIGSSKSRVVQLIVYGVNVYILSDTYSAVYGDDTILNCAVHGIPNVTIVKWQFSNGTDLDMSNTVKYSPPTIFNPALKIFNLTFNDAANYRCVGRNDFDEKTSGNVALSITGDLPTVTTNQTSLSVNQSGSVILFCGVNGTPTVQSVYWKINVGSSYKNVPGISTGGTITSPSLFLSNLQTSDTGLYVCFATNAVGIASSSPVNITVTTDVPMCPCSCSYQAKLTYWAVQNKTNYTMEELRLILAPVVEQLKKELTIDTKNLSATVNKLKSAPDSRMSSKSLGILGIVLLSVIFGGLILIDLTSLPGHFTTIKKICRIRKKKSNS